MTQPAKANEPSMEEILASIRRIIADDDAAKVPSAVPVPEAVKSVVAPAKPAEPAPSPPVPSAPAEVAPDPVEAGAVADSAAGETVDEQSADILDLTEQMATPKSAPAFRTIDGNPDVAFDESPAKPAPQTAVPAAPPPLISRAASAAVDSAFNTLAQTVLAQNARTLEDLVREMLRPLLKSWLDENLPAMVERLVRAEIERVSRGR